MLKRLYRFSQTPDGDGIIGVAILLFGIIVAVGLCAVISPDPATGDARCNDVN
jgi:hypothetical protein